MRISGRGLAVAASAGFVAVALASGSGACGGKVSDPTGSSGTGTDGSGNSSNGGSSGSTSGHPTTTGTTTSSPPPPGTSKPPPPGTSEPPPPLDADAAAPDRSCDPTRGQLDCAAPQSRCLDPVSLVAYATGTCTPSGVCSFPTKVVDCSAQGSSCVTDSSGQAFCGPVIVK